MDTITQIAILIFSCSSVWAFAGTKYRRLGFIFGLCGQPFWIYTTFNAEQWGMFLVSLWFTGNHIRGLWNHRALTVKEAPMTKHKPQYQYTQPPEEFCTCNADKPTPSEKLDIMQPWELPQPTTSYGLCPVCGSPGLLRERRPDGNDSCENGHVYPSRTANMGASPMPTTPAPTADLRPTIERARAALLRTSVVKEKAYGKTISKVVVTLRASDLEELLNALGER